LNVSSEDEKSIISLLLVPENNITGFQCLEQYREKEDCPLPGFVAKSYAIV
jgi:hypothetical protein